MTNIMESCVGKILSFLVEPAITHGAYVIQYKSKVQQLEQENKKLREKKERIQGMVDIEETNYGRVIEPEVSSWLEEVKQMERDIANFLRQQENGEQMERDFANFLRQQENGEQMERDFANFLRQQENRQQMERDFANFLCQQENRQQMERDNIANFLRQQENGEQMERDFSNILRQQENGESFKCFLGCMCPNLMWRHKRGMKAENRKEDVNKLIIRGELLQTSQVARDPSFQSEPLFDSSQYYTTFQSRASVVDEINNALKDSGVDMIGVHGPGGTGKTTMVKEVAKEAKKRRIFDEIVMAVVSKDPNTSKLQEELASQLGLKCEQRSELGKVLLNALLKGKRRILVILDDLWQVPVLNAIGIPTSGLGDRGCKILLTSRDEEVLKGMEVHLCFPIGYLERQEAWELFTKVTGEFRVHESIASKVSERCGGLPIAIVAVGAALKGKEEAEWRDALHQLENCPLKYIEGSEPVGYTPLKWSYDFLKEEDAKSCFLLCCLFPEDAEISIDDLVRYSFALGFLRKVDTLKVARNRVQAMVNMLKRSCLLLNGKNKNFVKMHDVIRDLAISITEEKQIAHGGGHDWAGQQQFIVNHNIKEWPKNDAWEHHTAISLRINDDNISFPCGVLHCLLMHTLVLKLKLEEYSFEIPDDFQIPNDFFQGMKGARVLDFKNIVFSLPSSVLELDHLRMLRLNDCQLKGDWSTIQNLKNQIEILSFEGSNIKELPQEIGKLTRLRSLDLRVYEDLIVIPKGVISNLIHLEELYVIRSFKEWDTTIYGGGISNASIAELNSLNQLTVLHVGISTNSYKIMKQEWRYLFEKLDNFYILIDDYGDVDYYFGEDEDGSLNALELFSLQDIEDEFYLLMDRVEKLRLENIENLRYLHGKPQLHFTSRGERSFSKLIELYISGCDNMKYLFAPSYAKALEQLKTLHVRCCSIMEQIIGVEDHCNEKEAVTEEAIIFSRLETISLGFLPKFRSFCPKMEMTTIEENSSNPTTTAESIFNEKVSFPILENLTINDLSVEDIWNKQTIQSSNGSNKVSFSQVKHITVTDCHKLVNVFPSNMLVRLQNLETLYVKNCSSLTLLVENLKPNIQSHTIKVFPKLRDLVLDRLPKLMKIWPNDEDYCSNDNYNIHLYLKTISISSCGSLRHAFSAFVARHLAYIEGLRVHACLRMEVILSKASREGVIDDGIIEFCQLKRLELKDLSNLKSFSQSKPEASHLFNQVIFPKIKYLYLDNLKSSKEIQLWDLLGTTQEHLHTVNIFGCQISTKVSFHHQKRRSRTVDNLVLQNCQGFKHFIDLNGTISIGEEQFADVKKLKLRDLPELMVLWNKNLHEIGGLRSLTKIIIINCSQLRSLFTHSMAMALQQLKMLLMTSCEMMEEIIIIEENNINFAGKEKATHHIEFPKLKWLILDDLPNLKNFCGDERGSFSFSSLHTIVVQNCPKMKTFAFGQIFLQPRMIKAFVGYKRRMEKRSVEYRRIEIANLNALFKYWNADNNRFLEDFSKEHEYYLDADIWNKYDSHTFDEFFSYFDISTPDDYFDDDIATLFEKKAEA